MAKRMDTIDFSRFSSCACLNLRMAARAITRFYDRALQPSGLRATQFNLLCALAADGSATITHLAQQLVMDRTTLSRNLKPLVGMGLIAVEPGEDRRSRVIALTDDGLKKLSRHRPP